MAHHAVTLGLLGLSYAFSLQREAPRRAPPARAAADWRDESRGQESLGSTTARWGTCSATVCVHQAGPPATCPVPLRAVPPRRCAGPAALLLALLNSASPLLHASKAAHLLGAT